MLTTNIHTYVPYKAERLFHGLKDSKLQLAKMGQEGEGYCTFCQLSLLLIIKTLKKVHLLTHFRQVSKFCQSLKISYMKQESHLLISILGFECNIIRKFKNYLKIRLQFKTRCILFSGLDQFVNLTLLRGHYIAISN